MSFTLRGERTELAFVCEGPVEVLVRGVQRAQRVNGTLLLDVTSSGLVAGLVADVEGPAVVLLDADRDADCDADLDLAQYVRAPKSEDSVREECSICMEHGGRFAALRVCAHTFHYDCLQKWVRVQPTCPVCRRTVRPP